MTLLYARTVQAINVTQGSSRLVSATETAKLLALLCTHEYFQYVLVVLVSLSVYIMRLRFVSKQVAKDVHLFNVTSFFIPFYVGANVTVLLVK